MSSAKKIFVCTFFLSFLFGVAQNQNLMLAPNYVTNNGLSTTTPLPINSPNGYLGSPQGIVVSGYMGPQNTYVDNNGEPLFFSAEGLIWNKHGWCNLKEILFLRGS